MEKENLSVVVEVKTTNYQNGKLKTVFGGKGQITMEGADQITEKEESITFRGSDCGTPKMEAEYQSKSIGLGETKTTVEIDLKGQTFDMTKGELIDAIASGSKLTKADAGRALDKSIEDIHKLTVERSCDADCAKIESTYETKISEINQ